MCCQLNQKRLGSAGIRHRNTIRRNRFMAHTCRLKIPVYLRIYCVKIFSQKKEMYQHYTNLLIDILIEQLTRNINARFQADM